MFHFFCIFLETKKGNCFDAVGVGLAKDVAYPLKPLSCQETRSHSRKTKSYEPKILNEIMLPMRRNFFFTISHTQHRTPHIPSPISTKEKELGHKKIGDSQQ